MTNILPAIQPRNQSVDTFRLLAALSVIVLHVEYLNVPGEIAIGLRLISRWAIPFFFIFSGYFLAAKKANPLNIQPATERLIWIFLLWSFIYAFVVIDQHDISTSIKRITSPNFIYSGNFVHLWFIPSLIYGYIFVAFFHNYNLKHTLTIFSVAIIIIVLLSGTYSIINLGIPLDYDFAKIWLSIPFLHTGFVLHKKGHPAWWLSVLLIVFGVGLQIFEARFLYDNFNVSAYDHQFLIGTIPFAIGMAGLALSDLKFLKYTVLSNWGREYSLGIYLIHPLLLIVTTKLIFLIAPELLNNIIWRLCSPLIIFTLCLFFLGLLHRYLPSRFNFLFGRHLPKEPQQ